MTSPSPSHTSPRRRFGAAVVILAALVGAAAAGAAVALLRRPQPTAAWADAGHPHPSAPSASKTRYQCPMHPAIVQDEPGTCPICGMNLVPMEEAAADPPSAAKGERKIVFYRSPMDPKKTSPLPAKDEMGMDYLPVYQDELEQGGGLDSHATVSIDPGRQQLIGLKTTPAAQGPVGGSWRTVGKVAVDETRVRHVNVKVAGFVERIYVDFIGKPVRRGQALFALYSPELLSVQNEYLLAIRTRKALAGGDALASTGEELVEAARMRLELWDVPRSEIERLERTGKPSRALTLVSPISGVVTQKSVVEGMRLEVGEMPYEITDLSQVWVLADVYESDLRQVKVGMPATLTLKAFPNETFSGSAVFIDPLLDPKTRTAKVRLAFPNPVGRLKPEMFGEVTLKTSAREGLRIPADAVIQSGTRNVVFVAIGEGKFQPREVQLGEAGGDYAEILQGVREGEQVVVRANFLIDSESRLKASLQALGGK